LKSIIWRKILEYFPQKPTFFSTEERKTRTSWMLWGLLVNYQEIFI